MFLDRRVYKGSSAKVYPHTVTDTFTDEKENAPYTALCPENDYLECHDPAAAGWMLSARPAKGTSRRSVKGWTSWTQPFPVTP